MLTPEEETRYAELQLMALNAAREGNTELLGAMLEAGMPANLVDAKGNSLLMLASYHGHHAAVEMLLRHGARVDQRNHRAQTPLAGVAFKGDLAMAKLLVSHGADPHADQGGGRLPVHFAALFGHPEMVQFLSQLPAAPQASWWLRRWATCCRLLRRCFRR